MTDREIETHIEELFDENYRRLLAEGGTHLLTPRAREQALQQVLHYWRKMREVAVSVTDTEVRVQLPNRRTPKGRAFVIEGVVDLVREADQLRLYDIKTHYCGEVQAHLESYAAQLNVYAYVWGELHAERVHEMGVIAVQLPEGLRRAIRDGRSADVTRELESWNPLVPVPVEESHLEETFARIAETVDQIEDREFSPAPLARLHEHVGRDGDRPVTFATLHCRNCDGRFSCDAYRAYASGARKTGRGFDLTRYLEAAADDGELDEWIDSGIALDLERLFPEDASGDRTPSSARRRTTGGSGTAGSKPARRKRR